MLQQKLEVFVLGDRSKAMQKVARLKKAKRRRRKRSVARHSKQNDTTPDANDGITQELVEGAPDEGAATPHHANESPTKPRLEITPRGESVEEH